MKIDGTNLRALTKPNVHCTFFSDCTRPQILVSTGQCLANLPVVTHDQTNGNHRYWVSQVQTFLYIACDQIRESIPQLSLHYSCWSLGILSFTYVWFLSRVQILELFPMGLSRDISMRFDVDKYNCHIGIEKHLFLIMLKFKYLANFAFCLSFLLVSSGNLTVNLLTDIISSHFFFKDDYIWLTDINHFIHQKSKILHTFT